MSDSTNTTNAENSPEFNNLSAPTAAPSIFNPVDLALLHIEHDDTNLISAALELANLASLEPFVQGSSKVYGRFEFGNVEEAAEHLAAMPICCAALELLEKDLAYCIQEQRDYVASDLEVYDALVLTLPGVAVQEEGVPVKHDIQNDEKVLEGQSLEAGVNAAGEQGSEGQAGTTGSTTMSTLGTTLIPSLDTIPELVTSHSSDCGLTAPEVETPTPDFNDSEKDETTWTEVASALEKCARFARSVDDGSGCDYTASTEDARKLVQALEIGRMGLQWMCEEFNEEVERSLKWHSKVIEELSPLRLELTELGEGHDSVASSVGTLSSVRSAESWCPIWAPSHANDTFTPFDWARIVNEHESEEDRHARLESEYERWRDFFPGSAPQVRCFHVDKADEARTEDVFLTNVPLRASSWRRMFGLYLAKFRPHETEAQKALLRLDGTDLHTDEATRALFIEWVFSAPLLLSAWTWCFSRWEDGGETIRENEFWFYR